ncbi:MAG: hypothetical protein JNJ50_10225 [Acidobacteria bacterium]|nr:hypothetical protein [Acidobacteriota bacterium]
MKKVFFVIAVLLLGAKYIEQLAYTQSLEKVRSRSFPCVKREDGWLSTEIEGLAKSQSVEKVMIDAIEVKKSQLQISKEIVEDFDLYWQKDAELYLYHVKAAIRVAYVYEKGARKFAYSISYVPYRIDEKGAKSNLGSIFTFQFYDEDGNGVFETRCLVSSNKINLPKWVNGLQ